MCTCLLFSIFTNLILFQETIEEIQETHEESLDEIDSFSQFGLDPRIVEILKRRDIIKPLKIQTIGIPKIMNGANTVIAAETGCGKTFTYLLPMINEILTWKTLVQRPYNSPLGLIVTPSRELAFQIGVCIISSSLTYHYIALIRN